MSAGEKNAYLCRDCGEYTVTIDVDDGVTPMFLACRAAGDLTDPANNCRGQAVSMMYPTEPWPEHDDAGKAIPQLPSFEWYRPSEKWAKRKGPDMLDHVRKGGLALRPHHPEEVAVA